MYLQCIILHCCIAKIKECGDNLVPCPGCGQVSRLIEGVYGGDFFRGHQQSDPYNKCNWHHIGVGWKDISNIGKLIAVLTLFSHLIFWTHSQVFFGSNLNLKQSVTLLYKLQVSESFPKYNPFLKVYQQKSLQEPAIAISKEMELQTLSSAGESFVPSIPGSSGQGGEKMWRDVNSLEFWREHLNMILKLVNKLMLLDHEFPWGWVFFTFC